MWRKDSAHSLRDERDKLLSHLSDRRKTTRRSRTLANASRRLAEDCGRTGLNAQLVSSSCVAEQESPLPLGAAYFFLRQCSSTTLAISNYRSLRNLIVPLSGLNLITGPNGSGKSSVYRALRLLAETAQGGVITSLAREGGLQSTLWAGPEKLSRAVKRGEYKVEGTVRKERVSLRLGFAGDDFGYAIDLGLPSPGSSAFALDPEIKTETHLGRPDPSSSIVVG